MANDVVPAVGKKRVALLKAMPTPLQEIAQDFEGKLGRGAQGIILIQYNMGARLGDIIADEGKYGTNAVTQLAEYLNIPGGTTTLYNLRNLAAEFDQEYIKLWSGKPMESGRYMELAHWLQVMKLKERKDQEKLLVRVLKNSMSASDLEKEIRAGSMKTKNTRQGGRKPGRPSSAIAGLQKTFSMAQQLSRYEAVADKDVFDAISEMSSDDISESLKEKLEQTIETLGETEEKVHSMKERGEDCLERVTTILEEKAEEEEEAEEEAPAPKKKPGRKPKAASTDEDEDEAPKKTGKKRGRKPKVAVSADDDDDSQA